MLILIADDDRLIRFNMKSMLADILGNEDYSFLEAANGRDMLEICREKRPDIVFADIKMPYLSGLDAIEEAVKISSDIEFVIISGYSDFKYAKRGIALGIDEYMVKPIDPMELEELMKDLKKKIQKHKREDNSAFCMKVIEGYNSYSVLGELEDDGELSGDLVGCGHAFMSFRNGKDGEKRLISSLKGLSENLTGNGGRFCLIHSVNGIPVVLEMHQKERDYLTGKDFLRAVSSSQSGAVMIAFPFSSLTEAFSAISKIDDAPYMFIMAFPDSLNCLDEMDSNERKTESQILSYLEALQESDEVTATAHAREIAVLPMPPVDAFSAMLQNISEFLGKEIVCQDMKGLSESLASSVQSWIRTNGSNSTADLSDRLTEYIDRHYMNDISIAGLADHFGLTPNYVSTMFHQNTGIRFSDYLTETRIAHARHLLVSNLNASIKDIALMTGYNSPRHFASIFQKIVGMTPSSYRKSRTGADS